MSHQQSESSATATLGRYKARLSSWKVVVMGVPTLYLSFLFAFAIGLMFIISLWQTDQFKLVADWTIQNYVYILTSSAYHTLLFRSVAMAVAVTAASIMLGYPVAYYIARGLDDQQLPVLLLFAAPFFVGAMLRESAHQAMVGPSGLLNQAVNALGFGSLGFLNYGLFQVFLGELYLWYPFMMLSIYLSLELVDFTLLEAAIDSGASSAVAFKEVTWPLSLPGVAVGSILVFVSTLVSHIPSRFIGGTSGTMIGNILKELFGASGAWPRGAALGTILIVIALLFVGLIVGYTLRNVPTIMGGGDE